MNAQVKFAMSVGAPSVTKLSMKVLGVGALFLTLQACGSRPPGQPDKGAFDGGEQSVCVSNADCNSGFVCVGGACAAEDGTSCSLDVHCSSQQFCNDGLCTDRTSSGDCSSHEDCTFGMFCQFASGACVTCLNNDHCPMGETCLSSGACGVDTGGCTSNFDCGALVCETSTGVCVPCLSSADCPAGQTCRENACFASDTPGSTPCANQSQCDPFGKICDVSAGTCRACTGDPECGTGRVCAAGTCTHDPGTGGSGGTGGGDVQLGGDCNSRSDCSAGACFLGICAPCLMDIMCFELGDVLSGATYICDIMSGACVVPDCLSATDCPAAEACYDGHCGACLNNNECRNGEVCDASTGACVTDTGVGACSTNADCPATEVCYGGDCLPCISTSECDAGEVCEGGICSPDVAATCNSNADCSGGQVCKGGSCGSCLATSDCDAGYTCGSGTCTITTTGGGDGELGSSCGTQADCNTGHSCVTDSVGSFCTRPCIGSGDGATADCPLGYACQNFESGELDGVQLCTPADHVGASFPGYPFNLPPDSSCAASNGCQTSVCFSDVQECARSCVGNIDCSTAEVCWAAWSAGTPQGLHLCMQSDTTVWAPAGAGCSGGTECDSGVCSGSCSDGASCNDSSDCFSGTCNGTCVDHCRNNDACDPGDVCTPWPMSTSGSTFSGWTPVCLPAYYSGTQADGTSCTGDAQCSSDWCVSGVCTQMCGAQVDCAGIAGTDCEPVTFFDSSSQPVYSAAFCLP